MRLHLLGQPHLLNGDKVVPLSANHSLILAWLSLQRSIVPLPRVRLARAIWADCSDEQGRKRLANSLYRLRQDDPAFSELVTGDATSVVLKPIWTDTHEFTKLMGSSNPKDWFAALEIYQADLLEDQDLPWLETWRSELHQTMLSGLRKALAHSLDSNDSSNAISLAQRLIQLEPWNEDAHTNLIKLFAKEKQFAQAIGIYEKLEATLRQEFSSTPKAETQVFIKDLQRQLEQHNIKPLAPLVGRSLEWRSLTSALNAVRLGQGGILMLEGEPGLGKTRLLLELKSLASWHHITVLYGAAANGTPAYAPLEQAMQNVASLLEQATALIQKNLEPLLKNTSEAQTNPQLICAALERWLRHLGQPTVWLLDDLHWAGDLFWTVLNMLARVSKQHPVLLVTSARSTELQQNPKAQETMRELRQNQQALHFRLAGLSLEECNTLAKGYSQVLSNQELEQLHRVSAGNPLVFQELVLGNPAERLLENAFKKRFDQLSSKAKAALEAASVLGKHLNLATWEAMLEAAPPINQLLEARFLHNQPELGFQHDLTRAFVYEQMNPQTRQKWHGRAFEMLKTQDARADVLAHHAQEANLLAESVPYYRKAVDEAINLGAFQNADRLLERGFINHQNSAPNQLEALYLQLEKLKLTQIQTASLPLQTDLESLAFKARQLKAHDLLFTVLQMQFVGQNYKGDTSQTLQAANALLEFTREIGNKVREVTALTQIALSFAKAHPDAEQGVLYAKEAYVLVQNNQVTVQQRFYVLIALMNARIRTKEHELAWEILEEAESLVAAHPEITGHEFLLHNIKGILAHLAEHYELAFAVFQKQLDICYTLGDDRTIQVTLLHLADALKRLGRFEEALVWTEEFTQNVSLAKNWLEENKIAYYYADHAEALVMAGRVEEAEQLLRPIEQWILGGATSPGSQTSRRVFLLIRQAQGRYLESLEFLKASPETIQDKLLAAELYFLAGLRHEAELRIQEALAEKYLFSRNYGRLSLYYVISLVYQQATDLEIARFALLRFASQIQTLEHRQIMLNNLYYAKAIEAAWQQQTLKTQVVTLPVLSGEGTIKVTWTLDSGASDTAHLEQNGKVALRNHRLKRLMLEAQAQGAKALQRQLASALGVTVRTIEADLAQFKSSASQQ